MRAFGCWSRSRLGAGIGAGAASGVRKSCPRALLPRGPQFRLLGAGPEISVFFKAVILCLGWRHSRTQTAFTNCALRPSSSLSFRVASAWRSLRRVCDLIYLASFVVRPTSTTYTRKRKSLIPPHSLAKILVVTRVRLLHRLVLNYERDGRL